MASFVTDTGLAEFVTALVTDDVVKFIDWGPGTGQTSTSTNLATTTFTETRATGTVSSQTTNSSGDTYRVVGSLTANATRAVTEVGVFDVVTADSATMRIYGDFSVINLNSSDSITFTIDVVLDQA